MKVFLLLISAFGLTSISYSQGDSLFTKLIDSQFKGGISGWETFCNKNVIYPKEVKENNVQGIVVVSFTLDEMGKIKNPVIENSVCEDCDREAIRVLMLSKDKWKPFLEKDTPIAKYMEVSINFNAIPRADLKPIKEKAVELYESKKYDELLKIIQMIIRNTPYDSDFIMGKGIVLQEIGQIEEACAAFKRAVFLGNTESNQYLNKHCK